MHILQPIISFFSRLRRGAHFDPSRDWFTVLALSIILLISIIVWNAWIFDTAARGGSIGSSATSTTPIFSRSSIDAIQTIFTDRATEEAKYATGVYRYTDPSQ